jgi:molybdate transport system substrate-binding protein
MFSPRLPRLRVAIVLAAAAWCTPASADTPAPAPVPKLSGSLFVYCAAGVKDPIVEIAKQFESATGVKVELTFANSGQLLGQIETTRIGDVYIPGDVGFVAKAQAKNLISGEPREFCHFIPALYVRKGNPRGIRGVADLVRPGLKLALADPSAAIGQLQVKVFEKNGLDEAALKRNTVFSPATVIDVAMAVKLGTADAGIIWDALGGFAPDQAELVRIPERDNVIGHVAAATLAGSRNAAAGRAFLAFLVSNRSRAVFRGKGFAVDEADQPEPRLEP